MGEGARRIGENQVQYHKQISSWRARDKNSSYKVKPTEWPLKHIYYIIDNKFNSIYIIFINIISMNILYIEI